MTRKWSRRSIGALSRRDAASHFGAVDADAREMPARLIALLVRPTSPPLWLGIVVAATVITVETAVVHQLDTVAPQNAFGAVFLLGVLVVSARWGFVLSVMTTLVSAVVYVYFHLQVAGSLLPTKPGDWVAILVFLPVALVANLMAGQARLRTAEAVLRRREAEVSRDELGVLAAHQAALRRVATLAARGVSPPEVFTAVAEELTLWLHVVNAVLLRNDGDGTGTLVAVRYEPGVTGMSDTGDRIPMEGDDVGAIVLRTGRAARIDNHEHVGGEVATRIREGGFGSIVGVPIVVDSRVWGAAIVGSRCAEPLPPDTEARLGDFADLVATAIANAVTRAELLASRARIVAASDEARRRLERDLHDGAQQRLVSLGLEVRMTEASVPAEWVDVKEQLSAIASGLKGVSEDLRELSHGIHPAILSKGGLVSAVRTLARRSAVPVTLDVAIEDRFAESVEVAAYYVVAEALTNAAKHARASEVSVSLGTQDGILHLVIRDDGVGGASSAAGSGLLGLQDRVEALGGHLRITSPPGHGTTLDITIPVAGE
ncbi:Histidine kinase-, DNA gyrase B-, and HSP90-like ATPase [Rhodococcus koreensis]|uniref:Histidine kinase-, DNA gyrase B-, and HSP90-like ATPase n=2 Tax=Rhodococcus koreensis TaxID=99653 RepID=A0A1H4XV96_9NOCA|nr:Histidine kinase-, DNA gyrase B-, and HSP90-like ATPase [Rhodococcus koreensis]